MATYYTLPIVPGPQTFPIALAGVNYVLTFTYHDAVEAGWIVDISLDDDTPLLAGCPLVTGANLLAQYPDLGIGGLLAVITPDDLPPGYADLGTAGTDVYFVTVP